MSNPTLQSKIHLLMYCVANGVTPAGGILFEESIQAHQLDGTTESLHVLDELLASIKDRTTFADIISTPAGKNFLKSMGAYIGCYLEFQLEDDAQHIFWQDTYDIITEEKIHTDSLLWFTSLDLVVDKHYFKPINTLKEYFEYADAEKVSETVFAFLVNTRQAIKAANDIKNKAEKTAQTTANEQQTEQQAEQENSSREVPQAVAKIETNNDVADSHLTNNDTAANNTVANDTAANTTNSTAAHSKQENTPDLTALQQELANQKQSLKSQQSAQAKKSLFAKLLSNPFSKTPQQNANAQAAQKTPQTDTADSTQAHTKDAKPKPHLPEAPASTIPTEVKHEVENKTNNKTENNATHTKAAKAENVDILKQLMQDKERLDYLPSSEQDIRPTLSTQANKMAALVQLSKKNHTQAMVLLAILQLNTLAKKTSFTYSFDDRHFSSTEKKALSTASKLLKKSALHGNAAAQYFLSTAYAQGIIFEKNHKKHSTWLKIAVQNGHELAISQNIQDAKQDLASMYHEKQADTFDDRIAMWLIGAVAFGAGILLFF